MKNRHYELLRRSMRQYHRHHQWRLEDGLFIPHAYPGERFLSWWDDVGFILNGRRVMVWWVHPRMKYADAIEEMAWKEAGDPPARDADLFESAEKQWVKVGRSRKKVVSYRSAPTLEAQKNYYERLRVIEERISGEGIDLEIQPSMSVETLQWCTGVSLCMPIDVRNKAEVRSLAMLAKRLLKRESTVAAEFPDYRYVKRDWLAETNQRDRDRQQQVVE